MKKLLSIILIPVLIAAVLPLMEVFAAPEESVAPVAPASPVPSASSDVFADVKKDDYYYDAVKWAKEEKIAAGTTASSFSPSEICTRAQVLAFLYRASGRPEISSEKNPFEDIGPSNYYYKPVLWAIEKGISVGTSSTTFSPDSECTRAQIITFLWRSQGSPNRSDIYYDTISKHFPGAYYVKALAWAYGKDVISDEAVASSTFEGFPAEPCSRADAVYYIYKAISKK